MQYIHFKMKAIKPIITVAMSNCYMTKVDIGNA